jgi:hypothetical protein
MEGGRAPAQPPGHAPHNIPPDSQRMALVSGSIARFGHRNAVEQANVASAPKSLASSTFDIFGARHRNRKSDAYVR